MDRLKNFWPTRRKRKKLTFFNWMLWNEWKDKNHLGKKRLSYSNKTIVWNDEKKKHTKNYCILFSVSKDYLFRLWYSHGMEFIAKQWNLRAIHFVFVHKQLQQNAAHQLPICHIERSLSFTLSLCVTISLWSEIQWITIRFGIDNRHHRHGK